MVLNQIYDQKTGVAYWYKTIPLNCFLNVTRAKENMVYSSIESTIFLAEYVLNTPLQIDTDLQKNKGLIHQITHLNLEFKKKFNRTWAYCIVRLFLSKVPL